MVKLNHDRGKVEYEIKFTANGTKFEYEINAASGSVSEFSAKYGDDFFIYTMTGGDDITYNEMNNQIGAMRNIAAFKFGMSFDDGNITFQVLNGATHDYTNS